jgi:hypothetical protein
MRIIGAVVKTARFPRHFIRNLCFFKRARRFYLCFCESAMREIKNKTRCTSPLHGYRAFGKRECRPID